LCKICNDVNITSFPFRPQPVYTSLSAGGCWASSCFATRGSHRCLSSRYDKEGRLKAGFAPNAGIPYEGACIRAAGIVFANNRIL